MARPGFRLWAMRLSAFLCALALAFPANANPEIWQLSWPDTDFSRSSVSFDEILSGGPPKDGIPAIDGPKFRAVSEVRDIPDTEPVVTLELEGSTPRAYPIRFLMWHEIANDVIDDRPITVTFCPLCNSALVFDGRMGGETLTFGVSGKLRHSDMIMYDRQSESWWQQFTGEAIVGAKLGERLTTLPSWMESIGAFRARNPEGLVMEQPEGFRRSYGANPYMGYDSAAKPFLYRGENPPHGIPPLARVLRVGNNAWPLTRLAEARSLTEAGVTITWEGEMASALDQSRIAESRKVGAIRVRNAQGKDIPHEVVFAFAFHAFAPDGVWHLE